jgi:hypothetical protein
MADGIDRDELRRLVREVLKQALHGGEGAATPAQAPSNVIERMRQAMLPGGSGFVEIAGDLTTFARDVVHAAGHEDLKAAIMSGKLNFKAQEAVLAPPRREKPMKGAGSFNLSDGMLNEVRVEEIGRQYGRIVLGPKVVVTPLARDRARELKLELVRTKS